MSFHIDVKVLDFACLHPCSQPAQLVNTWWNTGAMWTSESEDHDEQFRVSVSIDSPTLFWYVLKPFLMAQMVKSLPTRWETGVRPLDWEDPLEKGMATCSSILAGEFHGQKSLMRLQRVGQDWARNCIALRQWYCNPWTGWSKILCHSCVLKYT